MSSFCETKAEVAAGELNVHSPTASDQCLLGSGLNLTLAPSDRSGISEFEAETIALTHTNVTPKSAVFGETHDIFGRPTHGQLVWVIDETRPRPPNPPTSTDAGTPICYIAVVNAVNGNFLYAVLGTTGDAVP